MENITLGDLSSWLGFAAGLIGSVGVIVAAVKKIVGNLFKEYTKAMSDRLDQQDATLKKIDLENCKNFLVSYLAKVENEGATDEIETARFWEQYQHYSELGGNSYIRNKVEKLKNSGKL